MNSGSLFSTSSPTFIVCCPLDDNHSGNYEFWFVLPWWRVIQSIDLCDRTICMPSMEKNVFSCLLSVFNEDFLYWVIRSDYLLCILNTYWTYYLQIFSPIQQLVFFICWWFHSLYKTLLHSICLSLLLFPWPEETDTKKKKSLRFLSKILLPMFSSRNFYDSWF